MIALFVLSFYTYSVYTESQLMHIYIQCFFIKSKLKFIIIIVYTPFISDTVLLYCISNIGHKM